MASVEERLVQLEVYAEENKQDIERRLGNMETLYKDMQDIAMTSVSDRIQSIEDAMNKIPNGIIDNWTEIEGKMTLWHKEEKDRKEAVQAIWKKMNEVTSEVRKLESNIETASNGDEMENMKINFANDMKDLHTQIKAVEERTQDGKPRDEDKSNRIDWEQRMKRADFNKPNNMTDGDKGFVK